MNRFFRHTFISTTVFVAVVFGLSIGSAVEVSPAPLFGVQQLEQLEPIDSQEVDSQVASILNEPGFRTIRPESWWERLQRRAGDAVGRVLGRLFRAGFEAGLWSLTAAVALVILFVVTSHRLGRRRAMAVSNRGDVHELFAEAGTDPSELLSRAEEARRQADHRTEIRLRFLAGLLLLERQGRVDLSPGLTTAMAIEQVSDPVFDSLAQTFDGIVYGNHEATTDQSAAAVNGWQQLLGSVSARGRT